MNLKAIGLVSVLGLVACGSESESDQGLKTKEVTQNVALTSNGATMSATYNQESAAYIGDGDTTASNFWAGNIADDHITVDFGQVAKVADVTVYTNNTSFSSSNPAVQVELSVDGLSWKTTMVPSFGSSDIACPTYTSGSGKLSCTFASAESAQYLRITTNAASVFIYEVEATGTVTVAATENEDSNVEDIANQTTFLEGSWLSPCEDYNEDGTVYGQSTFTFDAAKITVVNRTYASSSCEGNTLAVLQTAGNVVVGDDVVLASGETVTQVAFEYSEQTLLLNEQDDVTAKNDASECGYIDWAVGVAKDVFSCRMGENSTALDIGLIVNGELYLGVTPEEEGYPTELTDSPLTQL